MRRNPNYLLSELVGSNVLVPIGKANADFNKMITLNEMGSVIWNMLENDTTVEDMVRAILEEYNVTEEQAKSDVNEFIQILMDNNCIVED